MPRWCFFLPVLSAGLLVACGPSRFDGVTFDPPEPAPEVTLVRASGDTFDFARQQGNVVVLFFGYTHCPDICPTTISDWVNVKHMLGERAGRVRFVFVSVDPARDTPALTQQYVAAFDSSFVGLSGDSAAVATVEQAFHVTSSREYVRSSKKYAVSHSGQTLVIDPHGRLRLLYEPGAPIQYLVDDITRLLHGA